MSTTFERQGDIKKVLCDSFLVAPLFSLEKTPHGISVERYIRKRCQNVTQNTEMLTERRFVATWQDRDNPRIWLL